MKLSLPRERGLLEALLREVSDLPFELTNGGGRNGKSSQPVVLGATGLVLDVVEVNNEDQL